MTPINPQPSFNITLRYATYMVPLLSTLSSLRASAALLLVTLGNSSTPEWMRKHLKPRTPAETRPKI